MTHYLYAVASGVSAPPYCSLIKIGYTCAPQQRLGAHQIGCPLPLKYVGLWSVKLRGTAIRLESACHAHFAQQWAHGEWHQVDVGDLQSFIASVAQAEGFNLWSIDPSTLRAIEFLTIRMEQRHVA